MKASEFLSELEKIRLKLEGEEDHLEEDYYEYLGFYPGIDPETTATAFERGYWSTFIFAYDDTISFGLKILPDMASEDWPVVKNSQNYSGITFSNSLRTFIPFQQATALLDKDLFESVSQNWDIVLRLNAPLITLFGTIAEDIDYLKDYAFNPENKPTRKKEKNQIENYLKFWFHFDRTTGHKILRETIDLLSEDKKWLPDVLPSDDLGIWETRIKNLLMSRAKSNRVIYGNERVKDFIIEGFLEPHGYDAEDILFDHYPIANMSKISINAVVGYFKLVPELLPESFLDSHLYNAALEIDNNFNDYRGEQHYQAALILESENKPLEAWNALVSASYWAGVNGDPDGVEKHWQKAIEICEKQNWHDALDALTTQWEWYQEYKSKRQYIEH